ncbi:S1 family peptidase [Methylobacterium oryzae]|uniref:S1 family peptidase n=1 Tax=Methylobacterium oryzae TaxID=334852 RepID=UPI001F24D2A2|nr:serine protease [Methylobacterium oryzae]UIN38463.1 serine protease [Methylobacterium oryzae]
MSRAVSFALAMIATASYAASPNDILQNNTRAVVYLEVNDSSGAFIDSGTGFIVSHDGYVITAAHLKVDPSQKMWAIIGQRDGTRFQMKLREADEKNDVALWQLPQSASCRYAVTISSKPVNVLDRAVVLGFPAQSGLTPALVNIANLQDNNGFYNADGFLQPGYSGGPVFNEDGRIIALVHGGTLGGGNNSLIQSSFMMNLISKWGVKAGIDVSVPFADACYASCRVPAHGVEKWSSEVPWGPVDSGELSGGHTRKGECDKLIAAALAGHPNSQIDLLPGEGIPDSTGMWENAHKDFAGQMHYTYYCKGTLRSGPIFYEKHSSECGLWN